jgi:hypothetical protein
MALGIPPNDEVKRNHGKQGVKEYLQEPVWKHPSISKST